MDEILRSFERSGAHGPTEEQLQQLAEYVRLSPLHAEVANQHATDWEHNDAYRAAHLAMSQVRSRVLESVELRHSLRHLMRVGRIPPELHDLFHGWLDELGST